jgi:ATP-dependent exoDNAse (exonuclease V) beta subunit
MSHDNTHMDTDESIRRQALDISKSFIVQAPAGSGKTELLIQRYLKLLTSVSQPEEIVAITFTNKAANEMKQRVLSAIAEATSGIKPSEAHQITTYQYANEVLKRDKKRDWNLLHAHKRMKILTLDSLCSDIVNKSPITSKFGFGKKLLSDHELKSIYRLAAI